MEKFSRFADKTTGKLAFNQPIPVYTTLPFPVKVAYQIYLYTLYWVLIAIKMPLVYGLSLLWMAFSAVPFANAVFSRLLLLAYGSAFQTAFQASTLAVKRHAEYKLTSSTVICGQLTSPVDLLLYVKFFKPKKVVFPSDRVLSPAFAFWRILSFSTTDAIGACPSKLPSGRCLVFPEQLPTNQSVVMRSYLSDALLVGRPIICAASKKQWRFVAQQHPTFDFLSNCDDMGTLLYRQKLLVTCLKPGAENEEIGQRIQKGIATCLGVECSNQGIEDRIAYDKAYAEYCDTLE